MSVSGAFKLDHLQPVELIVSLNFSNFLVILLGAPISYYPRNGKRRKRSGDQIYFSKKQESERSRCTAERVSETRERQDGNETRGRYNFLICRICYHFFAFPDDKIFHVQTWPNREARLRDPVSLLPLSLGASSCNLAFPFLTCL